MIYSVPQSRADRAGDEAEKAKSSAEEVKVRPYMGLVKFIVLDLVVLAFVHVENGIFQS